MVAMDLATQKIYFVKDNTRIVEDSLVGPSDPTTIVDNIYSVGDMVYDPRLVINNDLVHLLSCILVKRGPLPVCSDVNLSLSPLS